MKTFGDRLRAFRKAAGLTQEHIALELGISKSAVSQWELNATQPDLASLIVLRDLLGVSLDELIGGKKSEGSEFTMLTPQEKQLLQWFRKLSPSKRANAVALLS